MSARPVTDAERLEAVEKTIGIIGETLEGIGGHLEKVGQMLALIRRVADVDQPLPLTIDKPGLRLVESNG